MFKFRKSPRAVSGGKPPPSKEGAAGPSAVLLLRRPVRIDMQAVVEELRRRHPVEAADAMAPTSANGGGDSGVIRVARSLVAVISLPFPVPDGWRQAAARAIVWPEAAAACAAHAAHMIISPLRAGEALPTARALTAVAGAICALHDAAIGVLWCAKVLCSAAAWAAASPLAFAPEARLPTDLWVSRNPFRDAATGRVGVLTYGLCLFAGREVLLTGPGSSLAELVSLADGLAKYLAARGPVIADGGTFGFSAEQRIVLRQELSTEFGLPVLRADVTGAA